jgi:NAD(P)-dependent dehydrogenase (short-subunit alcohol dehydrogenase family)
MNLSDKVAIVTGGASGIRMARLRLWSSRALWSDRHLRRRG